MNIKYLSILALLFHILACNSSTSEGVNQKTTKNSQSHFVASSIEKKEIIAIDSSVSDFYLMGKFDPKTDNNFELIDKKHADREGLYLRKEAYSAFKKMLVDAQKEGLIFTIKSATRNFEYQKGIWERKWTGKSKTNGKDASQIREMFDRAIAILSYSSMPGSSRHHWGTDFDLNAFNNEYFEKGKGLKEYEWLIANAHHYGFCQPYTKKGKERPNGYNEEKWHWSFVPLSKTFTEQAGLRIKNNMIVGFEGDFTAEAVGMVNNYILGINPICLE